MALVRIRAVDQNGNVLPFFNEPLRLETEGDIQLIGPDCISLKGGMGGAYVKSLGRSGRGSLIVKCNGMQDCRLPFSVEIHSESEKSMEDMH